MQYFPTATTPLSRLLIISRKNIRYVCGIRGEIIMLAKICRHTQQNAFSDTRAKRDIISLKKSESEVRCGWLAGPLSIHTPFCFEWGRDGCGSLVIFSAKVNFRIASIWTGVCTSSINSAASVCVLPKADTNLIPSLFLGPASFSPGAAADAFIARIYSLSLASAATKHSGVLHDWMV